MTVALHQVIDRNLENLRFEMQEMLARVREQSLNRDMFLRLDEMFDRINFEERILRARFSHDLLAVDRRMDMTRSPDAHHVLSGEDPAVFLRRSIKSCLEATRTLEAHFLLFELPKVSAFYKKLRFELFEIERIIHTSYPLAERDQPARSRAVASRVKAGPLADALSACPLYFIVDESMIGLRDPVRIAYEAINAGVRILQLRFKALATREFVSVARQVRQVCEDKRALLIINDRLDVALLSSADGVHVGEDDPAPDEIKRHSASLIVGATVRNVSDARHAAAMGADYLGCGNLFGSSTKPGAARISTRRLSEIAAAVTVPVVGIGGVNLTNFERVLSAGAMGFCSVRPFVTTTSVRRLVQEFQRHARKPGRAGNPVEAQAGAE